MTSMPHGREIIMATYRPNPNLTIKAIQWTGNNVDEIRKFTENGFNVSEEKTSIEVDGNEKPVAHFTVATWAEVWDYLQEDWVNVNLNDYIIEGTKGEFYPCEEGVFKYKYILAEDTDANELGLYEGGFQK